MEEESYECSVQGWRGRKGCNVYSVAIQTPESDRTMNNPLRSAELKMPEKILNLIRIE